MILKCNRADNTGITTSDFRSWVILTTVCFRFRATQISSASVKEVSSPKVVSPCSSMLRTQAGHCLLRTPVMGTNTSDLSTVPSRWDMPLHVLLPRGIHLEILCVSSRDPVLIGVGRICGQAAMAFLEDLRLGPSQCGRIICVTPPLASRDPPCVCRPPCARPG